MISGSYTGQYRPPYGNKYRIAVVAAACEFDLGIARDLAGPHGPGRTDGLPRVRTPSGHTGGSKVNGGGGSVQCVAGRGHHAQVVPMADGQIV